MKVFKSVCLSWAICLALFLACGFSAEELSQDSAKPVSGAEDDIFYELGLLADALTLIDANYVRKVPAKELVYGALDGMVSSLDSHSEFLSHEQYMRLQADSLGEFGGLGIKVSVRDGMLIVISPLEATPAQKAGVLPRDRIIKIDDKLTKDYSLDDAVALLRGKPGTTVRLTVLRGPDQEMKEFVLKRAVIKVQSVRHCFLNGENTGYIRIADFQKHTASDLNKAMRHFVKNGIKALIIDLRNNPGGLMEAAVMVCEKFIKKPGTIVSTRGRFEGQNALFRSRAAKIYEGFPIAVIINEGSASASEIVAAALRDNKKAVIIGNKSFGKGSVQTVIPLKDNSAIRLTTSYYYTPSGRIIHEKGIMPDIVIPQDMPDSESSHEEEPEETLPPEQALARDKYIAQAITLLGDKEGYERLLSKDPVEA
ncbi:MAG: S41 family peptidase [Candidatus Omnitrophica bacterium]|nr:S41 family peptidase [Candidatus Omnitrophota bacterium]